MIKGSNTKIKVSQATIDKIKKMGMTAALKGAPKASAEMQEGLRRMYGAKRLEAAKPSAARKFTAPAGANKKPVGRLSKSAAPKKNNTNTALKVGGAVAAGALLIASRGKAAGLAGKLSPQLAKTGVGRAIGMGAKKVSNVKVTSKEAALSTSGRAAAAAKRPVSQSQYDAMTASAKAKGIKAAPKARSNR